MFGTRKTFRYAECADCGTLQCLDEVPVSVAYPPEYYSFQKAETGAISAGDRTVSALRKLKTRYCLKDGSLLGHCFRLFLGEHFLLHWFRKAGVSFDSRILDVGCGSGQLLLYLKEVGFRSLLGIDPLLEQDIRYDAGVTVLKTFLSDVSGVYDFIMLNHVIEHMPEPLEILRLVRGLVSDTGHVLIRTPVADSYAYRRYGEHWASIDAPRHLVIPTSRSMAIAAECTGLAIIETRRDSSIFQFIASEQNLMNIASSEPESYFVDRKRSRFTAKQVRAFEQETRRLNVAGDGDFACFLMMKSADRKGEACGPQ